MRQSARTQVNSKHLAILKIRPLQLLSPEMVRWIIPVLFLQLLLRQTGMVSMPWKKQIILHLRVLAKPLDLMYSLLPQWHLWQGKFTRKGAYGPDLIIIHSNPPDPTRWLPILHILAWPIDECNNLPIPAQSEVYLILIFLFVCWMTKSSSRFEK